jgi:hypothetical protein
MGVYPCRLEIRAGAIVPRIGSEAREAFPGASAATDQGGVSLIIDNEYLEFIKP